MAKKGKNGWRSVLAVIGACAAVSAIAARVVTRVETQAVQAHVVEDSKKSITGLKEDGCDPANINETAIAVMDEKWQNIEEDVGDLKRDMKGLHVGQTAILKAIEDKL